MKITQKTINNDSYKTLKLNVNYLDSVITKTSEKSPLHKLAHSRFYSCFTYYLIDKMYDLKILKLIT